MKDPCRVCGVRLIGSQCRWIFNPSGKRQLQVILSHVLGCQVDRDPDGQASEFLCGKCVFTLERVVQCDVQIGRLQEEHATLVQQLQQEREHLKECVAHVYGRHNPLPKRPDVGEENNVEVPLWRSSEGGGSPEDYGGGQRMSEGQTKEGAGEGGGRGRRSVSMDLLGGPSGPGGVAGRSSSVPRSVKAGTDLCPVCQVKNPWLQSARLRSRSLMYLDLVYRKGTLSSPGPRLRSASLQSLNLDHPQQTEPLCPLPQRQCRESKIPLRERLPSVGPATSTSTPQRAQPSIISDLLQLLRSIPRPPVPGASGSRIPIPRRRPSVGQPLPPGRNLTPWAWHRLREAEWRSLQDLTEEFNDDYMPLRVEGFTEHQSEVSRLETAHRQLREEMNQFRATNQNLSKTLEDTQNNNKALSGKLEDTENELTSEKNNTLKQDKTIQGLTLVLKEKEKEIEELYHEIEDREEVLVKARETAHKAQLQKYQGVEEGVEEHQSLLMEKQEKLAQLQGEHQTKLLEAQKLQRSLGRQKQELSDLQQAKEQLDQELEELQQQKKKVDKALNEVQNQLQKLTGELGERESSLKQQCQELLEQTKRRLQGHEVTIQRLTTCLTDKEQQLQEYMNITRDMEQSRSPGGSDTMLSKLRERLKQKEKALEQALDDKFAALEEKDNEIHQLHLSLREKSRDLETLNNLLSYNEDTINSFDTLIKEKDVELQHLVNILKNLQQAKQDVEDNLNWACREKDAIISQLQLCLECKTKDMEEMANALLSQSQSQACDLAEQMGQRLKVTEAMLAEAVKARERLVANNKSTVEGLLSTITSNDQLLKESAEHYNRTLSERTQEIQELKQQLFVRQQQLAFAEKQSSEATQEGYLEAAELRALLTEKDSIINKLLERGQERDQFLAELGQKEPAPPQVMEIRQTIKVLQERLEEREAPLPKKNNEDNMEKVPLTKNTLVILKKELAQKTDALKKALKRENELKMSLADLESVLSELEGRIEVQAASIDSLTPTLGTKDKIINEWTASGIFTHCY